MYMYVETKLAQIQAKLFLSYDVIVILRTPTIKVLYSKRNTGIKVGYQKISNTIERSNGGINKREKTKQTAKCLDMNPTL